jgi:hypothetical protein
MGERDVKSKHREMDVKGKTSSLVISEASVANSEDAIGSSESQEAISQLTQGHAESNKDGQPERLVVP